MLTKDALVAQVREVLIKEGRNADKYELYHRFVNESNDLNLTEEDFYKDILRTAHKSIDWDYLEEKRFEKVESQRKLKEELEAREVQSQHAAVYIDRLIKIIADDDVLEAEELKRIFEKAETLQQNPDVVAQKIDRIIDARNLKPYPKPDLNAATLKDTLVSTNWYSAERYKRITAPPEEPKVVAPPVQPKAQSVPSKPRAQPPKRRRRTPVKSLLTLILFSGLAFAAYEFIYTPWQVRRNAPRYYVIAQDVVMRSTQYAGSNDNIIATLKYGTELPVYKYGTEWCATEANGKEGYVSTRFIADKKDYYLLHSIFGDGEASGVIASTRTRLALLDYFKRRNYIGKMDKARQREAFGYEQTYKETWQVFTKPKTSKYNTVIFPRVTNPNSKHPDFGVIIKNTKTKQRKFLFFSFNDNEVATLVFEEAAPPGGDVISVRRLSTGYDVKYTRPGIVDAIKEVF